MKTKATNPALSIIGWIALALVDIVLAGLLFFGLLYFFIYPYDLPLNNRSLRETPGLAEGTLVDVTATNAHFRQPINSPLSSSKLIARVRSTIRNTRSTRMIRARCM